MISMLLDIFKQIGNHFCKFESEENLMRLCRPKNSKGGEHQQFPLLAMKVI